MSTMTWIRLGIELIKLMKAKDKDQGLTKQDLQALSDKALRLDPETKGLLEGILDILE